MFRPPHTRTGALLDFRFNSTSCGPSQHPGHCPGASYGHIDQSWLCWGGRGGNGLHHPVQRTRSQTESLAITVPPTDTDTDLISRGRMLNVQEINIKREKRPVRQTDPFVPLLCSSHFNLQQMFTGDINGLKKYMLFISLKINHERKPIWRTNDLRPAV